MYLKMIKSLLVLMLLITGCDRHEKHELRLAISPWIGYSPLYYAEEMGWLKEIDIELVHSTSLQETVHYFQAGVIDAFAGTQYEASLFNDDEIVHFLALDRSYGGDVVLSNHSLETVLESKKVTTYFEIDTVNQFVFNDFINKHGLSITKFDIYNKSQVLMKDLRADVQDTLLIITYEPYATILKNKGFKVLGSTKDSDMLVLDSIYVNASYVDHAHKSTDQLQRLIKKAYQVLEDNPNAYYEVVKEYMENPSYDDFVQSLVGIQWLVDKPASEINRIMKNHTVLPVRE